VGRGPLVQDADPGPKFALAVAELTGPCALFARSASGRGYRRGRRDQRVDEWEHDLSTIWRIEVGSRPSS
jgi:hypothetical protein